MAQIEKTTDYSKFSYVDGNRNVDDTHLKKLVASIEAADMTDTQPIVVNKKFEIIDGQHRFEACRELGLPIFYVVDEGGASLDSAIVLNTHMKRWTLKDFMESHIKRGNKHYAYLKEFIEENVIPISVGASLLDSQMPTGTKAGLDSFRLGAFKSDRPKYASEVADLLNYSRKYIDPQVTRTRDYMLALAHVVSNKKEIDIDRLKRKIELFGDRLERKVSKKENLRQLEFIYNMKQKGEPERIF